jgi:hypothetical protein
MHTHSEVLSKKHRGIEEEAGEVSRSVANLMLNPERDPAMDLLGEEAIGGMTPGRVKRLERHKVYG